MAGFGVLLVAFSYLLKGGVKQIEGWRNYS